MSETWEAILSSPTPKAWIDRALDSLDILLIDHAPVSYTHLTLPTTPYV